MKNFLLLFLFTFLWVALLPLYPSVGEKTEYVLPDDEYILAVMLGMGTDLLPAEALKAVAVTLRTYTAFHGKVLPEGSLDDIIAATSSEHGKKVYDSMREAVYATSGEYITFNGKIINACFHLSSNGVTADGDTPYLKSAVTPDESSYPMFYGEKIITPRDIELCGKGQITRVLYGGDGKAKRVDFENGSMSVSQFIQQFSLASVDFDIHALSDGGYTILSRGEGNGLGLSLYGAYLLASDGKTYKQIICNYFYGTEITRLI